LAKGEGEVAEGETRGQKRRGKAEDEGLRHDCHMAWMAYLPDPTDDGNEPILFSDDEISLDDFLEADEETRKEMTRGQKEPQEECYSAQDTDPASTRDWVHKTTSSKPEEDRLDCWDELVEGERDNIDERVDEAGNQPIPQLAKPKPEEVERTDHDLLTTKSARDEEDQAMALWLYDDEDEANQATVTVKNAAEDLEPPHTSSDKSRGAKGGEGVSWVNPRKQPVPATKDDTEGRRKVYPNMEDDAESILTIFDTKDDAKSVPVFFDNGELISTPTDPNATLSKGQCSYKPAEMPKTGGIPYHKTSSHTPMGTSPVANQLLGKTSATLSEAVKRDFRDLGGTRNMRLIYRKEEDLLGWEDPGEAPRHKTEG
jgi:hypothetical protein